MQIYSLATRSWIDTNEEVKELPKWSDWGDKLYISLCDHHDHLERI